MIGMTPMRIPPIAKRRSRFVPPDRWILLKAIPPNPTPRIPIRLLGIKGRGSVHSVKRDMEKLAMASQLRGGEGFSITRIL
jgi:hypothetical protein